MLGLKLIIITRHAGRSSKSYEKLLVFSYILQMCGLPQLAQSALTIVESTEMTVDPQRSD